jgi:hypothetical protein
MWSAVKQYRMGAILDIEFVILSAAKDLFCNRLCRKAGPSLRSG